MAMANLHRQHDRKFFSWGHNVKAFSKTLSSVYLGARYGIVWLLHNIFNIFFGFS